MSTVNLLNFDKEGTLQSGFPNLAPEITDVVLFSHGWREGPESASGHYQDLADPLDDILAANSARWQGRTLAYFGVIWPSDKYSDDLTVVDMRQDVSVPISPHGEDPLSSAQLQDRSRGVAHFLGIDPDVLARQSLNAAQNVDARDAFLSTLRDVTAARHETSADAQTKTEHKGLFRVAGAHIFDTVERDLKYLSSTVANAVTNNPMISWLKQVRNDGNARTAFILNLFAYNEMKIRAGLVGRGLAASVLDQIAASKERIHLVGHSFGARLMTAATAAAKGKIANLILLEGAFSQNALSRDTVWEHDGAFRVIIDQDRVVGRIVAVHSDHDAPVWIAYPLASRPYLDTYSLRPAEGAAIGRANELGPIFGGPDDPYGAIGANGPQNLASVIRRPIDGLSMPALNPGVHALDCTSFVAGHSDVWKRQSAYIIAAGLLDSE